MKRRRIVRAILLSLAFLAVLLAVILWSFPQQILTVDSGPVKADLLVVLGGAGPGRTGRAAELFKEGEAPAILVSGWGDCVSNGRLLEQDGVPAADITLECRSRTTRENAEFSIPLIKELGARRVIIVTSWYHSRRALRCFEHYAPDIRFYSRPSYFGYVHRTQGGNQPAQRARKAQWQRVRGYANSEYLKLLGYWVCYGVCPF
jgi:uncharacterized SAM-binding protein YcdF (DUF218 family)